MKDNAENPFTFLDPDELRDGDLTLKLAEKIPANPEKGYVPAYDFHMYLDGVAEKVGEINVRIGETRSLSMYGGHIGYGVNEKWRGRSLAARACKLLFPLAYRHGMKELWITCDPANTASARTCEKAGGEFVEIVDLPSGHDMYEAGKRQVMRFRFVLD